MKITFLGTGNAQATACYNTCFVMEEGGKCLLVDGGGGNLLIGDLIDMQFLGSAYNPNLGSAISLVLMVIILICMGIMNQFDDGENVGGGMIL